MEDLWSFNFLMVRREDVGNCFSFNINGDKFQGEPNLEGGLIVHLKPSVYYLWIHAPSTVPTLFQQDSHFLSNSTLVNFYLEERRNLPHPHGSCSDKHPQKMVECHPMIENFNYSSHACTAFKFMGEIPIGPNYEEDEFSSCHYSRVKQSGLRCYSECVERLYDYTYKKGEPSDVIRLEVYSETLERKIMEQVPSMTFDQLLGSVGGLLGLWLGASMLTILEVLELVANLLHCIIDWFTLRSGGTRIQALV